MRPPRLRWLFRSFVRLGALLAVLAVAAPAFAQTAPPTPPNALDQAAGRMPSPEASAAAAPVITMPVPKKNEGAAYPKQALDEGYAEPAEVSVTVTVSTTGAVTDAVVDNPIGHGFDEAAVAAARAMEFDPATRNGKPVAARTRIAFKFVPPLAVLEGHVLRDVADRPIPGATVTLRDAAGQEHSTTTDAEGHWRIDGLRAGRYHIRVAAEGRTPHEADEDVAPGESENAIDRLSPLQAVTPVALPAGDAGTEEPVVEVDVRGQKPPREVVKRTLEQREINRIPGTGGDALKSLQNLPGVARPPALSGLLIVRGAAPQDSVYFVDGTPIPIVYHFGGLYAVLPTEMIDKIDFYPGNFSTQYGRAMGAVVDVGLIDPKSDKYHALAEVNLIDARVVAQGPILDTGWHFAVAGRRSYVDTWLGPVLIAAGAGVSVAPVYYDFQAVAEKSLSKHSSLRFAAFGSDDQLAILLPSGSSSNPGLAGSLSTHTGFWRGQVRYVDKLGDQTEFRVVGAFGQDIVDLAFGGLGFHLVDYPVSSRAELSQKLARNLTVNIGYDGEYTPYTLSAVLPPLPRPGQPPPGPFLTQQPLSTHTNSYLFRPGFYTEWEATPWHGGRFVPGLRLDYAQDTGAWDFDPRVTFRQDVIDSPRTTIKAGAGLFSQPPQPQETNAVFGMQGLTSNRAYQYDVGVEYEFNAHVDASIDGFYKQLDHLVTQGYGNTGTGLIYGMETLLRYKPDEHFFGWIAYTLSRSLRRDAPGMPLELSLYDETHVLTVLGSYRLGRGWELGARFRLTSGYMYTPDQYGFYDENVGQYLPLQQYPANSSRLPLFHALDIRVDKTWRLPWGTLSAYLDITNIYNNGNVDGISYDFNSTHTAYTNDLPILPSLGLRLDL
jgi:TonB family protein